MEELKHKKILIVDDEPEIRTMIDGFLRKEGFTRIYQASACAEAWRFAALSTPTLPSWT